MATRSVQCRGFSLSIAVPETVAARFRRTPAMPAPSHGRLIYREPTPVVTTQPRSVPAALGFFRAGEEDESGALADLSDEVDSLSWYHTIEMPDGRVTSGQFDHRLLVPRYGLPVDMTGQQALDVATFDGFWAFEMERRGAAVTAVDLDSMTGLDFPSKARVALASMPLPVMGRGFEVARAALGSQVRKVVRNVYDLNPDDLGTFDFVHVGDLLLHLRRPLAALEAIRSVTRHAALIVDVVDPQLHNGTYGPLMQYLGGWEDVVWWVPSLEALTQLIIDAGFASVHVNCVYELAKTHEQKAFWRASITARV